MAKKLVKRRKLKVFTLLLVLIILGLFALLVYFGINDSIKKQITYKLVPITNKPFFINIYFQNAHDKHPISFT